MNKKDVWLGLARHVLTALGPVVALVGPIDSSTYDVLAGAFLTIAGTAAACSAPRTATP